MVKDTPNTLPENMIRQSHTSRGIHEDVIFLSSQRFELLQPVLYAKLLSWYHIILLLSGGYYNMNMFRMFSASVQYINSKTILKYQ